ncbi:MAG: HEAT repeat domain-containing protein [Gemmatimonadota bacterium]
MIAPATVLERFADLLATVRDGLHTVAEQEEAIALLRDAVRFGGLTIQLDRAGLIVNGHALPDVDRAVALVRALLLAHRIRLLQVVPDLAAPHWVTLSRALLASPGTYRVQEDIEERLGPAIEAGIAIVPDVFPAESEMVSPFRELDLPPALADTSAGRTGYAIGVLAAQPQSVAPPNLPRAASLDELLTWLAADPAGPHAGWLLEQIVNGMAGQLTNGLVRPFLASARRVIACAERGDGTDPRYLVAVRRMLTPQALDRLAPLLLDHTTREDALALFRRGGAEATEALARRLAEAELARDRRVYFDALRQMREGSRLLTAMLADERWYVARNAADLCGEMGIDDAAPMLARLLRHADERVRRSALAALAKLGQRGTWLEVTTALEDPAPSIRAQAARLLGGWGRPDAVQPLIAAAERETEASVRREMLLALGRCGSAAAVAALGRAVQAGHRFFGRKPISTRLAAIEGLGLAGNAAASYRLVSLLEDQDEAVRRAARAALAGGAAA